MDSIFPPGDPRVENWPLMKTPFVTIGIVAFYLIVVVWLGQKIMRRRESGFNIRNIMVVYNAALVIFSVWLWFEFCVAGWFGDNYSFGCQPVDRSRRPKAMRMARACWFFYVSKLVELLDTFFFVLRKKFELVSFLHVFHHAILPFSWWFGAKYVPGGLGTFHAMLNCFVHTVMYSYYCVAALGPQYQRYLWWKKYITTIQIIQFILIIFHSLYTLSLKNCEYPKLFTYWILFTTLIFLYLFAKFYSKAYNPKRNNMMMKQSQAEQVVYKNK